MPQPDALAALYRENDGNENSPLDNFTTDVAIDDVDDAITESEQDAEEEIDQLDSDSDTPPEPQPQQQPDVPAPKKPPPSRSGERRPGQTLLPTVRVENVLQAEGLLGNLNLSKEGIFLLSVATEEFIRRFVKLGHGRASYFNRNMVRYDDMAAVVKERYDFNFLRETIPTPRTLYSAFHQRDKRERELLKDDPAMQFQDGRGPPPQPPSPDLPPVVANGRHIVVIETSSPGPDSASVSKMKPMDCPRVPNKRQLSSKSASTAAARVSSSTSAGKRPLNEPTETWEEWKEKSRRLYGTGENSRPKNSQPSTTSNGASSSHHPPPPPGRDLSDVPRLPPIPQWDESEPSGHQRALQSSVPILNGNSTHTSQSLDKPPSWTGPLTGPGSAFLQGPGGPFPPRAPSISGHHASTVGSSSSTPAPPPGRTIYSADTRIVEDTD